MRPPLFSGPRRPYLLLLSLTAVTWLNASANVWACTTPAGQVASLEGKIDVKSADQSQWIAVKSGQTLCVGDTVRVLEHSRAALVLINDVVLRLDQKTTLTLGADRSEQPAALDLATGIVHVLTRYRQRLTVQTPFMNALVDGTEFSVDTHDQSTHITVAEGTVQAVNTAGRLVLKNGASAGVAVANVDLPAPQALTIRPIDAVQWALYYPMIIAPPPADNSARTVLYQANQLLTLGRVDEAQATLFAATFTHADDLLDRQALLTLIAIIKNDLTPEAENLAPDTAAAALALSYVRQAQTQLPDALLTAQRATVLSPRHAAAWARLAELQLLLGDLRATRLAAAQALSIDPAAPRARSWLAFADLLDGRRAEAAQGFDDAVSSFPGDPLPRLGRGMLRIAAGALTDGRRELELAVMLDPGNTDLRAYLGRAYLEENRDAVAATEFAVARALDPQHPGPWLQEALRKAAENRPSEAVNDVQAALTRNDARAVVRPQFMLDQDRAAQSTSLAALYRDIGFEQLALSTARQAVQADPQSASAHRFLADSFASLPGNDVARVSELLQSQLRQPLAAPLIQTQALESNLPVLGGLAPTASYQELNPLFNEGRRQIGLSAFVGNHSTLSNTLNVGTVQGNTGLSIGQYHYETEGYRPNNDFSRNTVDVLLQHQLSYRAGVQAELLSSRGRSGDITQRFDPQDYSTSLRREFDSTRLRLGGRYAPTPDSEWLGMVVAQNRNDGVNDQSFNGPVDQHLSVADTVSARAAELQYSQRLARGNFTLGGGTYREHTQNLTRFTADLGPFNLLDVNTSSTPQLHHNNLYGYGRWRVTPWLTTIGGLSADEYDNEDTFQRRQLNPKLGLVWQATADTQIRAGAFRVLKRSLVGDQTLEPTEVAGFTQLFDDPNGTSSKRVGVGIDSRLTDSVYTGVELSKRQLSVPFLSCSTGTSCLFDWRETRHRAYVYWQANAQWSAGADYLIDTLDKRSYAGTASNSPVNIDTRELPLSITYHAPGGWFVRPVLRGVDQRVTLPTATGLSADRERFWLADAVIGYRRAQGRLQFSLEARNLFNRGFRFQDTNLNDEPRTPRFQPDRSVVLRATATF